MKKRILSVSFRNVANLKFTIPIFAILCLCTACSGEDDDEGEALEGQLLNCSWVGQSDNSLFFSGDYNVTLEKDVETLYFLGHGEGICKFYRHYTDLEYGTSRYTDDNSFTYSIHGNKIKFGDFTLTLKQGKLVSTDGRLVYKKNALTSDEKKWLESKRYYYLPDRERLDFVFYEGIAPFGTNPNPVPIPVEGTNLKKYGVFLNIFVEGSQRAYSRGITSITAKYTISGGNWSNTTPTTKHELYMSIYDDVDTDASLDEYFTTLDQVTITATFTAYDSKNKKDVYIGTATYKYPENVTPGDNGGNNTGTGGGTSGGNGVSGSHNGHEYVDLGLSVKWATCNVGASSPEEYGNYYAWGETETKSTYDWSNYKWWKSGYKLSEIIVTKYCTDSSHGTVDNKTVLDPEDDVAHVKWGGNWRMPTNAEMTELYENCTWANTTQGGKNGCKVTSKKNGNSIFLPNAGVRSLEGLFNEDESYCWSSSLYAKYPLDAWFWRYNVFTGTREEGLPVRPVCP